MPRITSDLVRGLLRQPESEVLDFKRKHCTKKADDRERSKVLKDLLAFANTERTAPAYILIGVDEAEGGGKIVGIPDEERHDDAELHDFVQSKLNNTLRFAYSEVEVDGKWIGVIAVDSQQVRPLFSKSDFGEVREKAVYVRRGSRNTILSPHEVAAMMAPVQPPPRARAARLDSSTKELVRRWRQVFQVHGVQRSQIPLLLPAFGIRASHLADDRDIADLLTAELRRATCELFNVSLDWLEAGGQHHPQNALFPSPDMHQPLSVLEKLIGGSGEGHYVTLVGLKAGKGELFGDREREPFGFVLRTTLTTIADREVYAFYPIAGLDNWSYPKHRFYAKRLILAAAALHCHAGGIHVPEKTIRSVCEGECFAESTCRRQHSTWHPDDYAYLEGQSAVAKDSEHLAQIIAQAVSDGYWAQLQDLRARLGMAGRTEPGVLNLHWSAGS